MTNRDASASMRGSHIIVTLSLAGEVTGYGSNCSADLSAREGGAWLAPSNHSLTNCGLCPFTEVSSVFSSRETAFVVGTCNPVVQNFIRAFLWAD